MNKICIFLFSIYFCFSVQAQRLVDLENPDPDSTLGEDYLRYNRDNKIYKPNLEFVFDYLILDGNDTLKCQKSTNMYGIPNWSLVKKGNQDSLTIQKFGMYVLDGTLAYQTSIGFSYYNATGELDLFSQTGLIENAKNIWLHPIRKDFFDITEFNCFPFVKMPLAIGKKWRSGMTIGHFASYERFNLKWDGILITEENLEITGKTVVETALGKLDCWVVSGISKSKLTNSQSTFYFNENYGFVKMDYLLFDKRRLIFDLVEVKNIITVKE